VTVVSVASPTSNASHKSLTVNVALGQQILTVQQSTSASPVKLTTSHPTTQVRPGPVTVYCALECVTDDGEVRSIPLDDLFGELIGDSSSYFSSSIN